MKKRKIIGLSLTVLAVATVAAIGITSINSDLVHALFNRDTPTSYSLSLNSNNAVSTAGDHVATSATGGAVTFTYTNVASYNQGHTRINNGGSIVNKDQITSIESFKATFNGDGVLKARIAYVVGTWGEYFTLNSGTRIEFGSKPYFLEIKAENSYVNLTSAIFTYSCEVNPDAVPHDTMGSYDITFKTHNTDSGATLDTTSAMDEIDDGLDYVSGFGYIDYVYAGKEGIKFSSSKHDGYLLIEFDTTVVTETITSVTVYSSQFGKDSGVNIRLFANDGDTVTGTVPVSGGGDVVIGYALESLYLDVDTEGKRAYVSGISLNYGGSYVPGAPENPTAYETGFTANDANRTKYTTNSIFANDNGLLVQSIMSDSTLSVIPSSLYTYVIKDSNNQTINPNAKFPATGTYTLTVSYAEYIPVDITLNVGEYIYMVDVSGSMTKTSFTTADVITDYLAANFKANIKYSNNSTVSDIPYAQLVSNGLGLKLLNKNISYDMTKPFGTAGDWSLRVYSLADETNIKFDIALTVNAIPVQSITLDNASATMYPDDELQLVATINPSNATIQSVIWTSSNESVATVDDSGLVTAVAVGGATITATAIDGSNVYGTCTITVEAKPATTDYDIDATDDDQVTTNSTSSVVFTNSPISVTIDKHNGTVNANNYVATSGQTRVYGGQKFTISAGGTAMSKIVIHGHSGKGVGGFTGATWTNATMTYDGLEVTLTPTTPTSDVYGIISATCSFAGVTVTCGEGGSTPSSTVYPTLISVTGTNSIAIGGTSQLTVNYNPSETNVKNVTYSSSNTNVATVSNSGLVTGVAQGNATITAYAVKDAQGGKVSATINITVTPIAVTGVSLDQSTASVKVGKTITLVASITPANATNKSVTWTSSSTAIATVNNNGVVSGVAAGTANITVTTADGNKTATCAVTVTASSGEEEYSITYTDLPSTYQTGNTVYTASSGIKFQAYNCAGGYSSKMQFKASGGYIQSTESLELQSLTIHDRESNTLTVYGSNTAGSFSTEITGTNDVYDLTGYSYFKVIRISSGAAYCSGITVVTGIPTPTDPTSIILSPTSADVGVGGTKQLSVSYVPGNANQNKEITWTSSNTNVATVSSTGLVSVKSTASAGQTATITAKLTNLPSISQTCTITVVEQQKDDHTVLIYICGADLESKSGLASGDIAEILAVSGQPDDVNIVIETGGASKWSSSYGYGISSTQLDRWHISNRQLVKDTPETYASMGLASTLQKFIQYGLTNFPAERTGLILWNHGGGMRGVCYDEKKNDDNLLNSEVRSAVSGALNNCGMSGQKLEWIGYDACLMAVQDIAETNSAYFNYMIASEESEAGEGWDYDTWVDDLYAKKSTQNILTAIVDGFIQDNGGSSYNGDQTLAWYNLSYATAYKNAWEAMAQALYSKVTNSNRSSFNSAITSNVYHFAESDYDYFCTFDAYDFIDKLASNSAFSLFRIDSSYTTAVKNALANLVGYSVVQRKASRCKGIAMYWCNSSQYSDVGTYYTASETNFTYWRQLNIDRGYYAS